jgi:phenylalanine-4-hydroxylase
MPTTRPFFVFDEVSHGNWRELYARQIARCERHATGRWLEGIRAMQIGPERIPDFERIHHQLQARNSWSLLSTEVQFSSSDDWFDHLERRIFLITEYIRDQDHLDYTPLPDIWHDAFGHLPFLWHQDYVDVLQRFGQVYAHTPVELRRRLGNLWWYTIEFGLIREQGEVKALGTGLMSSPGELENAFAGNVIQAPFVLEEVEATATSHHTYHPKLFVLEDFRQVGEALELWASRNAVTEAP